jgi:citrate lyase gamma subunit
MSAPVEHPVMPAPVPAAMPAQGDEEPLPEIEGIDTVDLDSPQGNWLFKRIWWERAEQKYEKIRGIVQSIFESRMGFFSLRNDVDKSVLDPFYIAIGLSQGELQMLLDQLVQALEKEREDKGALDANERAALSAIRQEGEMIEQMHKDVMAINQLDRDIDDALSQLMEQVNRVRGYDSEAWQAFKEIARVLDDTKARELYYQVDTAGRNIKDIKTYIDTSFAPHFEQLVKTVREQVERVQQSAVALKEKGVDLKLQVERTTKGPVSRAGEQEEEEEEVSGGFFSSIFSAIGSFFSSLWGIIRWPYDLIFGGSGSDVDEDVDTEEAE